MELVMQFVNAFAAELLLALATILAGYIGMVVRNFANKYITDATVQRVVLTCVQGVEQIYKDIHGDQKLAVCVEKVSDILDTKGIKITDDELYMMIEAAVGEFNKNFKG